MSEITLDKTVKQELVSKLQDYLADELDTEAGEFEAEFLLDFIAREAGHHWYNKGLDDARTLMMDKLNDSLDEAAYGIDDLMQSSST
ncbi:DUF2164 domain-containing protein [Shewanella submarina]|uniref:DUF2164 domain-containing protein n=1 Tax=Shewanella submarina TaxID=2016376 RepID=A0ABV7GJI7_9GAMM|nr:DUF2164 domain-containing protein [Shewanella submarina]MCL1036031.1 DUF2164 domain-containing protein [Shewanella submarina]